MNLTVLEPIANAILYEGYLLYPYRPSAIKNRHRWTFGVLVPHSCGLAQDGDEAASMQTECLVVGNAAAVLHVLVRFLQSRSPSVVGGSPAPPTERTVRATGKLHERLSVPFSFAFSPGQQAVAGILHLSAECLNDRLFKVTVRVENVTPFADPGSACREEVLPWSFLSTHLLLGVDGGEFVSSIDPPEAFREHSGQCRNIGTWPVLAGPEGQRRLILSAPIILYDYPRIAPESPGDLFDGTEIDEVLTLRILTLTDQEKRELRATDERARALLDRTEALAEEQLLSLHGMMRNPTAYRPGDRVRLRPSRSADAFDLLLTGKTATVASVEQDLEGEIQLAVTLDDDPGRDLGEQGFPGHRFFFRPDEVERIAE